LKPTIKLGHTLTPDGSEVTLHQHDQDFYIKVNREELMCSRRTASEHELGRLGCVHLTKLGSAKILIGGLGMGYTVRAALDVLPEDASVIVVELLPEVVRWNREIIGHLSNFSLQDQRVQVLTQDVFDLLKNARSEFDAVLLDVDNGPHVTTDAINDQLYTVSGLATIQQSLKKNGRLAVWSASLDSHFEERLKTTGFAVDRFEIPAYHGPKAKTHFIWIAK